MILSTSLKLLLSAILQPFYTKIKKTKIKWSYRVDKTNTVNLIPDLWEPLTVLCNRP